MSQGEPQLLLPFLRDSPRSASRSDPGSFQITASLLRLGAYEILYLPFKNRVSVSYSPLALLYANFSGLQSQMFWGLLFLCRGLRLPLLGGNLCNCNYPSFCGSLTCGCRSCLYCISTPPSYPPCCDSFFISLDVENPFC